MNPSSLNRAICTSVRARSGRHSGQPSKRLLPEPGTWRATLAAIAGLMVFVGAAQGQPDNDTCANAVEISEGLPGFGDNAEATSDLASSACSFNDGLDVWYTFTAPSDGVYRFQFQQDFFLTLNDPSLAVFGTCDGSELACVDTPGGGDFLDLAMSGEQTVFLRVAGTNGATGTFSLAAGPAPAPPPNDDCAGAIALTLDEALFADNLQTTVGTAAPACWGGGFRDIWYEFTAPEAGEYRFTASFAFSLALAVYGDCTLGEPLACAADCNGFSRVTVAMTQGQTVKIVVGFCDGQDAFFSIRSDLNPPTPANDECINAVDVSEASITPGTTRGASGEDPDPFCSDNDTIDVWYRLTNTAAFSRMFILNAVPIEGFDPTIAVLDGCNGSVLACDDNAGPNLGARTNIILAPNQAVYIRVSGWGYSDGNFDLTVSEGQSPAINDECSGAIAIEPDSFFISTNENATGFDDALTPCANNDLFDLWYTVTNPFDDQRVFTITVGGVLESTLAIFDGCGGNLLWCDAGQFDPDIFPNSRAIILAEPNQTLFIRIAGNQGALDSFTVSVSAPEVPPPVPAHDTCESAALLTEFPFTENLIAGTATPDPDQGCDRVDGFSQAGVWYTFTPAFDAMLFVRQVELDPELAYAIYSGPCDDLVEGGCAQQNPAFIAVLAAGAQYHLLVSNADAEGASPLDRYNFTIDLLKSEANADLCADAPTISVPTRGWVWNAAANNEGIEEAPAGSCNTPEAQEIGMNNSVYLRWVAPSNGTLSGSVDLWFSNGIVSVYEGACGGLTEIACADEPEPATFETGVLSGHSYIIQIGSQGTDWYGSDCVYELNFTPGSTCAADFDGGGGVTVADLFAYLDAWFAQFPGGAPGAPNADFDHDFDVDVADLFGYLDAWFAEFNVCS